MPWLVGLTLLVALVTAVLLLLAFLNVFDGMEHLNHVAGQANKCD
jgi:hypothetical protein